MVCVKTHGSIRPQMQNNELPFCAFLRFEEGAAFFFNDGQSFSISNGKFIEFHPDMNLTHNKRFFFFFIPPPKKQNKNKMRFRTQHIPLQSYSNPIRIRT
ncbi:hypothetical protein OUZ56_021029 [Daphnia magna]|uniref:Uncharacterized protein n=1 Tax=Daphnia magna TaxID=35525 RepID=A0ABQ9ZG72_9CRUS|nr:hypothetical protein OUZ56_021029 [Daphnia magna]